MCSLKLKSLFLSLIVLFCLNAAVGEYFSPSINLYVPEGYPTIQDAIDAASPGDTVVVAPGAYQENIDFLGKNITVRSVDPDDPSIVGNTVIDAGGYGSVVTFKNGEGPEAVLSGFTIMGGAGTINPEISNEIFWGAGIYCESASPTITQNIIERNYGPVDDLDIVSYGGGITCFQSSAIISRNIVKQNRSYAGAGIMVYIGRAAVTNNIIRDNTAIVGGGVVLLMGGELVHNTLRNNTAEIAGNIYAVSDEGYESKIINNIVINSLNGGGIYCEQYNQYTSIRYNDIWNNAGGNYIEFSDQTGINGNISVNPAFIDDYHINNSSPCYEAGDPMFSPYSWQRDIDGEAAVMNQQPDIGADEVTGDARPVADAGLDQYFDTIPENIVLDGSGSFDFDPDDTLNYQWVQTTGPEVNLVNSSTAVANFAPTLEGVYVFELTVDDGILASPADEILVVVGNRAPIADAGENKTVQIGTQGQLDGTGSYDLDPGDVLQYDWTQIEGPAVTLQDSNTVSPYFDCLDEGVYVFELVVSDGDKQGLPDRVELVTVDLTADVQDLNLQSRFESYAHYGDVSGNHIVYGVGSACDVTWISKYTTFQSDSGPINIGWLNLIQPKIDGGIVVWMTYGDSFGNPWYHEPSNCSVFARNIFTGDQMTLRKWTWSDSYGYPVVSGKKVIWVEHHDLDPNPLGSSNANNWWNTPYSICGADLSDWNSPTYFTVDENVGHHDPYPCHNYAGDFDDIVDIDGNFVVWEGDGDIYGADISNLEDIKVFVICDAPGRQYDPAVSDARVVWTDERNDSGDIYGADISDRNNIEVFEIIKEVGIQSQPAIDGPLLVYVDGSIYEGLIKVCCFTKHHGNIDIPIKGYFDNDLELTHAIGTGPAVDGNTVIWQTSTYGNAQGVSLNMAYSIADGSVENRITGNKYEYIQHAINEAQEGDEIVVQPGVYMENVDFLGKNVTLSSTNPGDPDIMKSTILKGGLSGPVVTFSGIENQTCVLNGLTITCGNNNNRGGGICGNDTQASIFNCIIRDNSAAFGGGIADCKGVIKGCAIINNVATANGGGFVSCGGVIENCVVYGNTASNGGGFNNCNGLISNCTITDNMAYNYGGGLRGSSGTVVNCTVRNNIAAYGGGLASCEGVVDRCIVANNSATTNGGGFVSCGGAITNCLVYGNTANNGGGFNNCNGFISNCTIADNMASTSGGGLRRSNGTITNSIVWSNLNDDLFECSQPTYSCYPDSEGEGCVSVNPMFKDPNNGDYSLLVGSAGINTGDPGYIPASDKVDLVGNPRLKGIAVDMGAYEFNPIPVADAGGHQTVYAFVDKYADVWLDGTGSYDEDGDALQYFWYNDNDLIAEGAESNAVLPVGEHVINLIVNDGIDDSEPNSCVITVIEPFETTARILPAVINLKANRPQLIGRIEIAVEEMPVLDPNEPMQLLVGEERIDAQWQRLVYSEEETTWYLVGFFDSKALFENLTAETETEITLVTRFDTGQWIYGKDMVKVK